MRVVPASRADYYYSMRVHRLLAKPMYVPSVLNLLIIAAGLTAPGQSRAEPSLADGLATGTSHMVTVISSPSQGLEMGIPRDSWYAKGIALDLQGQWEESYRAYGKAVEEFKNQLRERPQWGKMIRGWLLKAEFQQNQSQRLKLPQYYTWGPPSASVIFYRASAKHKKWLGIRAFTGRVDKKLQREVLDEYTKALQQSPHYDSARIAMAALYHESGQHAKARQVFAKIQSSMRVWLAMEVAYYYTAAGEQDHAFELLEKAVQYNASNKRYILRCNDFDPLRSDSRYKKLVGEP